MMSTSRTCSARSHWLCPGVSLSDILLDNHDWPNRSCEFHRHDRKCFINLVATLFSPNATTFDGQDIGNVDNIVNAGFRTASKQWKKFVRLFSKSK